MTPVALADARRIETPNALMRTYASPSAGGAGLAVWRTDMAPGASGPLHRVGTEQVVVVLEGRLGAEVDGAAHVLEAGDAIVLDAGCQRRLSNPGDAPVVTLAVSRPGATATVGDAEPVPIPWAR